jgi:CRISPR-associated endonuclease/helicase Cas3
MNVVRKAIAMDLLALWGKTGDGNRYHPLLCHLLDVAVTARQLWRYALPRTLSTRISSSLGIVEDEAAHAVSLLAGLHDLGKASPGFQRKSPVHARELPENLSIPTNTIDCPHGIITAREVRRIFTDCYTIDGRTANLLGRIIGGHHGIFPPAEEIESLARGALGDDHWHQAREELVAQLMVHCGAGQWQLSDLADPAIVPLLAGFVSVADWLGSSDGFPPANNVDIEEYSPRADYQAQETLQRFGWFPPVTPAPPLSFAQLYPQWPPNALQTTVERIVTAQSEPYLLIVEAPMGMGKTEAALFAADHNLTHGITGGFFIGLPTQATTNAMYARVHDGYLANRGHSGSLNLQLIHGHAGMVLEQQDRDRDGRTSEEEESHLVARQWFTGRKRPLLAPFGVGTIDQALMAVLQTRHWFVRLFGLAGKTVIFDEVHAYDTYMSTILERLLAWLAGIGCSVILLSATLPPSRRRALAAAYSGYDVEPASAAYPRLTLAVREPDREARVSVTEVPRGAIVTKNITLETLPTDAKALAERLATDLAEGGCAAIICNTVNRAQEVYRALCDSALPDTDYLLFHARMPYGMREERENAVLARFGKSMAGKSERYARRAILVATQVVEQSLDLDFDWMASEMAPVDLLLQRMGRMHRHPANDRIRPPCLQAPTLHLLCDADPTGSPPETFGDSEYIYARYIMLRTWLALRELSTINVPDDIDDLIRPVYEGESPAPDVEWNAALTESLTALTADMDEARRKAECILIKSPRLPLLLLRDFNADLADDDDPSVHPAIRAATRDGQPSVTVVCLHDEGGTWRPWGSDVSMTANDLPSHDTTQILLRAAVPISQPAIFRALCDESCPAGWRKNAHLRHSRAVLFQNGVAEVGNRRLILDDTLGLIIARREDIDDVELQPD